MAYFFEDFEVGQEFTTPARTVTEADIVNFACFSWDTNPLHVDKEFAKDTLFGKPIAHGLCVLSMFTGLQSKLGIIDGSAMALLGLTWQFKLPVFAGDTISASIRVKSKRESRKRADGGIVSFDVRIFNQHGEVVQEGELVLMIKRR